MTHHRTGWADASLRGGGHVCAFSTGRAEQRQLLTSFVRAGLQAGDYCVVAIDDVTGDGLMSELERDLETSPGKLRLEVQVGSGLNLSNGSLADAMDAWRSILDDARREGYGFVRLGGEASWWLSHGAGVDMDVLLRYEAALSAWTDGVADVAMLCCYDMSLFPSGVVADLMVCHRGIVIDGRWVEFPSS